MHFQRIRRRRFKYHSQTWWVLTKDINRYALRYKYFLKFYRSRIAYWRRGMNQQSKVRNATFEMPPDRERSALSVFSLARGREKRACFSFFFSS